MGWVKLSFLVRPKRHRTACAIGSKDKARTQGLCALMVQNTKVGHLNLVWHRILIYMKLYTWVRFNFPPSFCPKDMEPLVPMGPKGKLGHRTVCTICPKGEARTLRLHAPLIPKAKLGHSNCVWHQIIIFIKLFIWVGFNYPPWLGPKDTEPLAPSVPKAKQEHMDSMHQWSQRWS